MLSHYQSSAGYGVRGDAERAYVPVMLNVTPSRNADAARDYFARSLSPGDYYAENGGVPSVWLGKGAERLGLHGEEVTGDVFGWLVHNSHPFTGDRLTQRNRANRLPGYDFTFHAPKSVSVLEAMGDTAIRDAFRDAVRETMGEIELEMQTRVRKGGVHENRTTGNMLWAEFVHDTTRPVDGVPDPQIHAHCYAINATFDETENCWKAGKFRALKRDAPYYQARFLNNLAFKVQALGYETARTKSGFELVGVPDTAIKSFSRRSRLIDELAEKYGIDDPRAKARIGQWSRESKGTRHTRDDLVGLWHDRMTEQEREAVFETLQRAAMRLDGSLMPVVPDEDPFSPGAVAPSACLKHAIEHCYERRSVVSEKQLAARAIMFGIGRVPSDTIDAMIAAGETPEGGRVFLSRRVDDQKLVTTQAVLEEERRMLDLAASTRGTCSGLGMKIAPGSVDTPPHGWMYSIDDGDLSPEQYAVCKHVLRSRDRVIAIAGAAGVGKTRLMREVARGAAYGGARVFAFAPNAETVEDTLKKSGFDDARTVSYLLTNERLQEQLRGQAIWIDEAGQLGAKTMRKLIELAVEKNARLILTGDTRQHTAVERGDAMRLLSERAGIVPAELLVIRRQNGLYREAIEKLAGGEATKGFDLLDEMEAIMELDGEAFDRFETLAKDYADTIGRGKSALVVSPTHAEGERATRAIRAELKERGGVGGVGGLKGEDRPVERLVATEWTQAERADPVNYAPGLVVQFHQNVGGARGMMRGKGGFTHGDRVEISRVEHGTPDEQGGARVWCVDGKGRERALPLDHAGRFDVYAKEELQIAAGEKLRITKNARITVGAGHDANEKKLVNGQMLTVAGFTPRGDIRLDNGMVIPQDFGHIAHGYCTTSHAAQGKTVDAVFIAQGVQSMAASSMEQFYVSASRAREEIRIYTDDKHELREAIVQSEQRLSASELIEEPDGGSGEDSGGGGPGGQTTTQPMPEKSPDKEPHRNPVRDRAMHNARLAKHAMLRNAAPQNERERIRERSLPMKQIDPKFLASAYQKRALKGREMEM